MYFCRPFIGRTPYSIHLLDHTSLFGIVQEIRFRLHDFQAEPLGDLVLSWFGHTRDAECVAELVIVFDNLQKVNLVFWRHPGRVSIWLRQQVVDIE
jgi:hypothetical protein